MNPSSTLQLAKRSWFNASTIKTKDEKFKDFRRKMDVLFDRGQLPRAILRFHNRLL